MTIGLALHHRPDEFLDRIEGRAPRPDQEPEALAGDVHDDALVDDHAPDLRTEVERIHQTLGKRLRRLGLLLDRHFRLNRFHRVPLHALFGRALVVIGRALI